MPKAEYRVEVIGAQGDTTDRKLVLEGPTQLSVTREDKVATTTGQVLGISGIVMIGIGLPFLVLSLAPPCTGESGPCGSTTNGWPFYLGASLVGAGAIATPTGWILFATTRVRIRDVTKATSATGPTLAVVPVPGGVGLSGGCAF